MKENNTNYARILDVNYPEVIYTIANNQYEYDDIISDNKPSKDTLDSEAYTVERLNSNWVEFEKERSKRLKETDHYGLSDNTMTTEMISYRQALRDLPKTETPKSMTDGTLVVNWPVIPAV
jgi:hypothetical protein